MKHGEYESQCTVMEWRDYNLKKYPELELLNASANGEKRDKRAGTRLKKSGVKAGMPDLHLPVARGEYHSLYIEMKDGIKPLSKSQKEVKPKLEAQGNAVVVCYSCDQAIEALVMYLTLHRLVGS